MAGFEFNQKIDVRRWRKIGFTRGRTEHVKTADVKAAAERYDSIAMGGQCRDHKETLLAMAQ